MSQSPNFGPRRGGLTPELVVLHYTAMPDCDAAIRVLCSPDREVSAHYLIRRGGEVLGLVDEAKRAWHAGAGSWRGRADVNSLSIGVELDNDGLSPFAAPMMAALEELLPGILARWTIAPEGVIGHSDMAPGRKIDPGPRFDWQRLAVLGLSVWPGPRTSPVDVAQFREDAARFGYPDIADDLLLETVRLRFRPGANGPIDERDCGIMSDLASRFGLDRTDGAA